MGLDASEIILIVACVVTLVALFVLAKLYSVLASNERKRLHANAIAYMPDLKREDVEELLVNAERWTCSVCAFENLVDKPWCCLCSTTKGYRLIEVSSPSLATVSRLDLTMKSIHRLTSQLATAVFDHMVLPDDLNATQRSARMRKQWTRVAKGSTTIKWHRHFTNSIDAADAFLVQLSGRGSLEQITADDTQSTTGEATSSLQPPLKETQTPTSDTSPSNLSPNETVSSQMPANDDPPIVGVPLSESSIPNTPSNPFPSSPTIEWLPLASTKDHKTVVGTMLPHGIWASLVDISKLPFSIKYAWFLHHLTDFLTPYNELHLQIKVNRPRLLDEAMDTLVGVEGKALCATMRFEFVGEQALDAGAVQREWYLLVAQHLLTEEAGLFIEVNREDHSYFPNPHAASRRSDYAIAFHSIGRFIGRALLDGQMLPLRLSPVVMKAMLGIPVSLDDMEHLDPVVYKSLQYVLGHTNVEDLALTFSATDAIDDKGHVVEVDLIENGRLVEVTDANKLDYVHRMVRHLLFDRVQVHLQALIEGLYDIMPPEVLAVFDHKEFELILCGLADIDVGDWRRNTVSSDDLRNHKALAWFWEIVEAMTAADQTKLLQYATGSSRVPVQGFRGLTSYDGKICLFTLKGVPFQPGRYPAIHACFNRIDLPLYPTKELMHEALSMVLLSDPTGFNTE
ncbi:Aste57867_12698 [Aphanomyces stellatus]|uniref:HECT-type E3 ubiquitin transferase n=1 Tax=Aphanomyces stellatus TaxID=120398 RepID=A0A485KW93_9STRA|nr:hypothetical protein As57867_012650 [Aphanomyces stellatus]VFT89548.1 Aste57867_12698 [Aphanomyces stellatus]